MDALMIHELETVPLFPLVEHNIINYGINRLNSLFLHLWLIKLH
jgi:hypothetical protein